MTGRALRVLHVSDIHCGRPFVPRHVAAAEALAAEAAVDAIIVSGDLSQRARVAEFRQARAILDRLEAVAPVLAVPGNHDTQWWLAPFGVGDRRRIHERWRALVQPETEPTLRLPGLSIVGLNSAAGTNPEALTWYPRDWRVKGGLTDAQLDDAQRRLRASPPGDLRILVVHHNVVRGRLSRRWGLARPVHTLDRIAASGAEVVCTGHDHEERVEEVVRPTGRFVVSAANTISDRMRGGRAAAVNVIEADAAELRVRSWHFDDGRFVVGAGVTVARHPAA
jgi:3',5'-cyclic AMP phosphodiesterase CpdA